LGRRCVRAAYRRACCTVAARLLDLPGRVLPGAAEKAEFARIGHYYATESMLLWDEARQRYDAAATPEFGSITLKMAYAALLDGRSEQKLGEHALFRRNRD
jgi:divinyl chlorophyllide a 8-vinyl-reductase